MPGPTTGTNSCNRMQVLDRRRADKRGGSKERGEGEGGEKVGRGRRRERWAWRKMGGGRKGTGERGESKRARRRSIGRRSHQEARANRCRYRRTGRRCPLSSRGSTSASFADWRAIWGPPAQQPYPQCHRIATHRGAGERKTAGRPARISIGDWLLPKDEACAVPVCTTRLCW